MIPDEQEATHNTQAHRNEHPIWKFAPVRGLDPQEILRINQPPGSEDVDLVSPNGTHVAETKGEVGEKEYPLVHEES